MERVMSKRRSYRRPGICVDEHIVAAVANAFRRDFKVIEAAKANLFRGRDEHDYLDELYALNIVFVTSDKEFVEHVIDRRSKHAGIVYIPTEMFVDEKVRFGEIACSWVRGGTRDSVFAFRGFILYPANDGVRFYRWQSSHSKSEPRPELAFSWDWLRDAE
jgi:hypothetical protein